MKVPAVLYAAKSTQDKHKSIPDQLRDGRKKAAEEGWEVVAEFRDEGFSAYSGNRGPGLKAAAELAASLVQERGTTCMLVAQHSDRFARGAGDRPGASDSLLEVWTRMRRLDVHLRTFQNDAMMHKPVTVAVASEQAHEESKRKSDAVSDGLRRRRTKGKPQGGKRRFGYRWVDGELVVIDAEKTIVERIFAEFLAGKSDTAIARGLAADGVPTALGGRWHSATPREIMVNPLYAGKLRTKDGLVDGTHEPCVSLETFEKAQHLRAKRAETGKGRGRPTSGKHLFRKGMLRCGRCGGSMVPRTTRPGKSRPGRKVRESYYCYEHFRDPGACSMTGINREVVDVSVYSYFAQVGLDIEATKEQMAGSRERKLAEVRALREQATREERQAEERLARVRRDYQDGKLAVDDWAEQRGELTAELNAAVGAVERLATQEIEIEAWASLQDTERDVLAMLAEVRKAIAGEVNEASATIDAVRAALSRLFEAFVVRDVEIDTLVHADLAWRGGFVIEPVVQPQAVEGYSNLRPVFRREPLYDAENNSGMA